MARHEVQEVKSDVIELEKKLNINQLLSQGKISVSLYDGNIPKCRRTNKERSLSFGDTSTKGLGHKRVS